MYFTIIIFFGCITTFLTLYKEYKEGKISRKNFVAFISPIITLLLLLITNVNSCNDKKASSKNYEVQLNKNDTLRKEVEYSNRKLDESAKEIDQLNAKNDSMSIVLSEVRNQNRFLHSDLTTLRTEQKKGFKENDKSINDISKAYGSRHLDSKTEQQFVNELSKFKCTVTILTTNGSGEIKSFSDQLERVFKKSGWQVNDYFGFNMAQGISQEDIHLVYHPSTSDSTKKAMLTLKHLIESSGYKAYYIYDSAKWKDVGKWIEFDKNEFNIGINPFTRVN